MFATLDSKYVCTLIFRQKKECFSCLESEIGRVRRQERNETEEIEKRWHNKPPATHACCQVGIAEAPVERHSDC